MQLIFMKYYGIFLLQVTPDMKLIAKYFATQIFYFPNSTAKKQQHIVFSQMTATDFVMLV